MRPFVKSEPAAGGDEAQQADIEELQKEEVKGEGSHRCLRWRRVQEAVCVPVAVQLTSRSVLSDDDDDDGARKQQEQLTDSRSPAMFNFVQQQYSAAAGVVACSKPLPSAPPHKRARPSLASPAALAHDVAPVPATAAPQDFESETNALRALSQAQALSIADMERRIQTLTEWKDVAMKDAEHVRQMLADSNENLHEAGRLYIDVVHARAKESQAAADELSQAQRKYNDLRSQFAAVAAVAAAAATAAAAAVSQSRDEYQELQAEYEEMEELHDEAISNCGRQMKEIDFLQSHIGNALLQCLALSQFHSPSVLL